MIDFLGMLAFRYRRWAPGALLMTVLTTLVMTAAEARVLVSIDGVDRPGVRRAVFAIPRSTEVSIEAVGLSDSKGEAFLSYGWILDLKTRRVVWAQQDVSGERKRSDNWVTKDRLTLPAGTYGAYFAAHGGHLPISKTLKILSVPLGKIEMSTGPWRDWDEMGDPDEWGIRVEALDPKFVPEAVPTVGFEPFPGALIRQIGLGDGEYRQTRVALSRAVDFRLWATGEWSERDQFFADGAWIIDTAHGERVWELTRSNTQPAGGAEKNRLFDGDVTLKAGTYLVTVATDLTHSSREWNANPPWDPDAWGLALSLVDPNDRDAVEVEEGAKRSKPVVAIQSVRNHSFSREPFYVTRDTRVFVRAMGEQDPSYHHRFADFGWIENQRTLEEVWRMDAARSYPAGGARKNRLVEEVVALPRGDYYLCYISDDSHAFDAWNAEQPFEPEAWGIALFDTADDAEPSLVAGARADGPGIISIAPVGNGEHVVKRFETTSPTRIRVIALGEGEDGEMYDFGWLEDMETGEVIWEMDYDHTRRAGGARKNREVETTIRLPVGRFALHYVSDGSHSFGGWNQDPPAREHLWGVTLVEMLDQ